MSPSRNFRKGRALSTVYGALAIVALLLAPGAPALAGEPPIAPPLVGQLLASPGKLATADLSGDIFNCSATNVGDTGLTHVILKVYDLHGTLGGRTECPDTVPHASCHTQFNLLAHTAAHCEILVVTGDQANVRGSLEAFDSVSGFSERANAR